MVAEIYRKAWWPPYSNEVAAAVYNTEAAAVNAREQSHGQATGRSSMADERVLREERARSFYSTVRMGSQGP